MEVQEGQIRIKLDEKTLLFEIGRNTKTAWKFRDECKPRLQCKEGEILFEQARQKKHTVRTNGISVGIYSEYTGFLNPSENCKFAFATYVYAESATEDIFFEWIPLCEEGLQVEKVFWPGEMEFEEKNENWYTLINEEQGILIPNTWKTQVKALAFDGMFGTAGGYMPWFAQVRDREGYLAICLTPWNAGYQVDHPEDGTYTHVGMRFEPSLGKMDYRRIIRYTLFDDCDYNDICKTYRSYVREQGRLCTLNQKSAKNPSVDDLIGCAFVHKGIKTEVQKNSDFYDNTAPKKNNHLTTFETRADEIRKLHELGVKKLYLHLDGWAQPGYDNKHPDYIPACKEAGGWDKMKELVDTMHECGYLFGIHDQYRDYYLDAPSFDEEYACRLTDGNIPKHQRWAGGPQSYLCATQAPYYVRRNFSEIKKNGIDLDCAYLDVFTCNEGDECSNPNHIMTRRDCYDYRNLCFEYLLANDILPSSEEASDWAIPSLVFCHYAPYDFMMRKPDAPRLGVPVPLYNLVYHDCIIEPWMMDKISDTEDYMLYALLNGGAPYLIRDGAYPNFDGAFDDKLKLSREEEIQRCKVVSDLHEKVAKCEMVRHEMIDGDYMRQMTTFSNGIRVLADFGKQTYEILEN